jgi:hypothetical protein
LLELDVQVWYGSALVCTPSKQINSREEHNETGCHTASQTLDPNPQTLLKSYNHYSSTASTHPTIPGVLLFCSPAPPPSFVHFMPSWRVINADQLTREGRVVVFHDATLDRMCGKSFRRLRVADLEHSQLPRLRPQPRHNLFAAGAPRGGPGCLSLGRSCRKEADAERAVRKQQVRMSMARSLAAKSCACAAADRTRCM